MRVLLTGAAGFIGSTVARALEREGTEVVGVDLLLPQAHGEAAREAEPPAGVHRLDVRDAGVWVDLLRGVDVVCHQAAMVGAGVSPADLPLYAAHNDLGTAALLAAMHEAGVDRLVQASSMVVYGEGRYRCPEHGDVLGDRAAPTRAVAALEAGEFDLPCPRCGRPMDWDRVPEDARPDPRSSYAASKLAQEHYAVAWARQAGGRALSLRYHNVYGPGMPRDTPYSGVAAMFRSRLERGEAPRVFEDGRQARR
jgi:dTDP-L-rhamnose 4-epimerase